MVALLLLTKIWEERNRKSFFLLTLISRGDENIRTLSHELTHYYADAKSKADVFVRKQLPLKTKSLATKTNTLIKERSEEFFGNIRGSRFLKKSDGISEFFKSMSDMENEGRIDDTLEEPGQKDL